MGSEHGQFFLLEALISEIKFNVADILEQAEVHLDKIHLWQLFYHSTKCGKRKEMVHNFFEKKMYKVRFCSKLK